MALRSPLKIAPYQMLTCSTNRPSEHLAITSKVLKLLIGSSDDDRMRWPHDGQRFNMKSSAMLFATLQLVAMHTPYRIGPHRL